MRASWISCLLASLLASPRLAAQDTNHVALVIGLHGPGRARSYLEHNGTPAGRHFQRVERGSFPNVE